MINQSDEREHRDTQENARHAANLAAGEYTEDNHQRVQFDAPAHQEWGQEIILKKPVTAKKYDKPQNMRIPGHDADDDDGNRGGERPDQWYELERESGCRQ